MVQSLGNLRRTHTCGALRESDIGREVVLLGWVHRHRDLGALVFLDVRDRYGITQAVADEGQVLDEAKKLRSEYVVAVIGTVRARGADAMNPRLETGSIEVVAREIRLLNDARALPFPVAADEITATEETRLRYRYLDLRRPRLQRNLALRHRVAKALRDYFDTQGFLEIETPILTKSTPEGARDYLVPSRVHPGTFYALPQSPQIFKQILMVAGFDRYVQIVKCFRDEDQRADRQPEFTQIDVEISFATQDLVCEIIEPAIAAAFARIGVDVPLPLPRMSYTEAVARYGSDKPDLRCGMPIADLSASLAETAFTPFRDALAAGGVVRALAAPGLARASRREIDELTEQARQSGGSGLVWIRKSAEGAWQSSALKALGEATVADLAAAAGAGDADLVLLAAGPADDTSKVLGALRLSLAKKLGLLKPDAYAFTWVVDFPLLEWDAAEGRWFSMHHPFTSPVDEDVEKLATDPGAVRAKAYDLVLNGSEIGGGSIRIHNPDLQRTIFRTLGISDEEARARFGFFIEALEYGTPPHGGIALGLDRLVAILAGEASIRDVMAFPKTAQAVDLMSDAPSSVDQKQLEELAIRVVAPSRAHD